MVKSLMSEFGNIETRTCRKIEKSIKW